MSEIRDILVEQVERLLADRTSPALLRAAEAGTWPEALWAEAEALGLPLRHGAGGPGRRRPRLGRCGRRLARARPPRRAHPAG